MNRSEMYAGDWCPHHACPTRMVGRPGSSDERPQCDECEAEFMRTLVCLTRDVA